MDTIVGYVGLASDIKSYVVSVGIAFATDDLRTKLFSANDSDFLRVKKSIGSNVTIIDVDLVDDDFIKKAVLGE